MSNGPMTEHEEVASVLPESAFVKTSTSTISVSKRQSLPWSKLRTKRERRVWRKFIQALTTAENLVEREGFYEWWPRLSQHQKNLMKKQFEEIGQTEEWEKLKTFGRKYSRIWGHGPPKKLKETKMLARTSPIHKHAWIVSVLPKEGLPDYIAAYRKIGHTVEQTAAAFRMRASDVLRIAPERAIKKCPLAYVEGDIVLQLKHLGLWAIFTSVIQRVASGDELRMKEGMTLYEAALRWEKAFREKFKDNLELHEKLSDSEAKAIQERHERLIREAKRIEEEDEDNHDEQVDQDA